MWMLKVLSVLCLVTVVYSVALTQGCASDSECTADNLNSYCYQLYHDDCTTPSVCNCIKGYSIVRTFFNFICSPTQYIGDDCSSVNSCQFSVQNAVCTDSKCACPKTLTAISKYNCVSVTQKKVGDSCDSSDACYYETDTKLEVWNCPDGGRCLCPANTKTFGTTCLPLKIGDKCTAVEECPKNAQCKSSLCECADTHHVSSIDTTACVLSVGAVATGGSCSVDNADCNDGLTCLTCGSGAAPHICDTKPGALLQASCTRDDDCTTNLAVCTSGKCVCGAGYIPHGKVMCIPYGSTGSACWTNAECTTPGTDACISNVCGECPQNTFRLETGVGCATTLNDPCTETVDCVGTANLFCYQEYASGDTCVTGKTCKCKKGYVVRSGTCVAAQYVGDSCASNDYCSDTVPNTVCTSDTCTCPDTHTSISQYMCVDSTFKNIEEVCASGDTCYYEFDGRLQTDAACTGAVCICPAHTKAFGISCRPVKIGDSCTANTECPLKSTCTLSTCSCDDTHTANAAKTTCDKLAAEDVCVIGERKCAYPLTCLQCVTSPEAATTKCGRKPVLLDESCTEDNDCSINVASCTESKCSCGFGYVAYGKTMCVPSGNTGSVCWSNVECIEPETNACIGRVCDGCPTDHAQAPTGKGCVRICTVANEAMECPVADNKECDMATRQCRCKAPAVPLGTTTPLTCTAGTIDSNCIDDSHCPNLANSACSGSKCGCASGFKTANNKCEKSGVSIKAAWMPFLILSGLIPLLIIC